MSYRYTVSRVDAPAAALAGVPSLPWPAADVAPIDNFHLRSTHRPAATAQLLHDNQSIFVRFTVRERHVRCEKRDYGGPVWTDSCVELFLRPPATNGYFNFEFNCCGAMTIGHIEDPTRTLDGFAKWDRIAADDAAQIDVVASLPEQVLPERPEETHWTLAARIPLALIEKYAGKPLRPLAGQSWTGNFYKCAEINSHPHWASWSPIGEELNFHQPHRFGQIIFA